MYTDIDRRIGKALFMLRTRIALVVSLLLCAAPALAQRLPAGAVPEHYELTVEPNLADATFAGTETITARIARPTTTIVLNAAEITFDKVTVTAGGALAGRDRDG